MATWITPAHQKLEKTRLESGTDTFEQSLEISTNSYDRHVKSGNEFVQLPILRERYKVLNSN